MRNDNLKLNDIAWNTIGTLTYSFVSLLLSLIIVNLTGSIEGGIFSFGFSTLAHLVYIITYFGIRPMHIVDVKYRYSFFDYYRFGIILSIIGVTIGTIYVLYWYLNGTYNLFKCFLLVLLILHGALDGFSDYFECEYQRVNKLYMCGQSIFFRIVLYASSLIIVLTITNNLLLSLSVALIVELIAFCFLNIVRSKKVFKIAKSDDNKNKSLFIEALPLFLVTFFDMLIFSSAKFFVDIFLGDTYNGFFNYIFMPVNVIYLGMTLFMKPLLTPLSNTYYGDKTEYHKLLTKILFLALGIGFLALLFVVIFGGVYLDLLHYMTHGAFSLIENIQVFNIDIAGYNLVFNSQHIVLIIAILGGVFYTLTTPMYFALIIENKQKFLLISYIITLSFSFFVTSKFVSEVGMYGASIGFAVSMFILFISIVIIKVLTQND